MGRRIGANRQRLWIENGDSEAIVDEKFLGDFLDLYCRDILQAFRLQVRRIVG